MKKHFVSRYLAPRYLASMSLIFLVFTIGVGFYSIWQVSQVHNSLQATRSFYVPVLKQLGHITGKWAAYQKSYERAVGFKHWSKSTAILPDMKINLKNLLEPNLRNLEQRLDSSGSMVEVQSQNSLRNLLRVIESTANDEQQRIFEASEFLRNKNYESAARSYARTKAVHQNFSFEIQKLIHQYESELSETQFSMDGSISLSHGLMVYVLISCLLTELLVLYKMRRWILPVFELTKVSQQIAVHGLSKEVHFPKIRRGMLNEVADLIREFSRMAITLMEREKTIQTQSQLQKEQNILLKKLGGLNEKIIQGMGSALILLSESHVIEKVNPVFCEIFGRKAPECLGKRVSEVIGLDIQMNPGFYPKIELIENRFFDISVSWVAGNKKDQGILVLIAEVTKLKEAEDKLDHLRKIGLAGNLSVQVAHEIRNPLHSMNLHLEMLKDDLVEVPENSGRRSLEQRVEKILDQVSRLDRITMKYLSVKTSSESTIENMISVSSVLSHCIDFYKEELSEQNITLNATLDLTFTDKVKGDADQLSQVFFNLIRNSIEALSNSQTNTSESNKNIHIQVKKSDSFVLVRIEDSGIGISDKIKDRIFEPFVTSKASGNGMGLCVSRHICIEHGGDLKIRKSSKFASGAAFELQLPV